MKKYKTKAELIEDMKMAFSRDNIFDKYTHDRLDKPKSLIKEYRENPTLAFGNNKGDWMFVWKNQHVNISEEWVKTEDLLNKLSDFLEEEEKLVKKCPKCGYEMFESMEPKVATLANVKNAFPSQTKYWRCSNSDCVYKEKIV